MIRDIVLICDDNYTLPTAVCINSIVRNSGIEDGLTIHVCTFSLSQSNVTLLEDCGSKRMPVIIHMLDYSNYQALVSQITAKSHVSKAALIKFELPNIFEELDGLLYIDSDIIIKDNITELLSLNLSDCYLAASYEFWREVCMNKYEFFKNRDLFFFNSGVMLLNLKKMREDNITEKLWEFKIKRAVTTLMDQESFNAVCGFNTLQLSIKYNYNPIFTNDAYIHMINRRYKESYTSSRAMFNDVKIIHYVGKSDKPWVYKTARHRKYWDDCYDVYKFGELNLTEFVSKKSLYSHIKDIYNRYGIMGFISFMSYKVSELLKINRK